MRLDDQSSNLLAGSQAGQHIDNASEEIEKFRIVQQASRHLYEALGPACTVHTQHLALLCSEATFNNYGGSSRHPEIQFKLFITHTHSDVSLITPSHVNCHTGGTMSFSLAQRVIPVIEGKFTSKPVLLSTKIIQNRQQCPYATSPESRFKS